MCELLDSLGVRLEKLRDELAEVEEIRKNLRKRIRELENVICELEEEDGKV